MLKVLLGDRDETESLSPDLQMLLKPIQEPPFPDRKRAEVGGEPQQAVWFRCTLWRASYVRRQRRHWSPPFLYGAPPRLRGRYGVSLPGLRVLFSHRLLMAVSDHARRYAHGDGVVWNWSGND